MHKGELEFHLVSDGIVWVDPGGPFGLVPRALYRRIVEPNQNHLIPQTLTCMLVRSEGKTILIDTGLGPKLDPKDEKNWGLMRAGGGLVNNLKALGISPSDIDLVICTHLHADHCGGNTRLEAGKLVPTFPNATYLVQRMEWADASHPDPRTRGTYFAENFSPLVSEGRMRLLHGDQPITRHVRCAVTPGHTRGHQSVVLESGGWSGLFVSDMATFSVHMARAGWLTAFDVEPLENIRTKQRWQRWALEREAWLFFIHDPVKPVARLREQDGRLEALLVEEARPVIDPLPTPQPILESGG
jgi:glyoxylase-like metal-dependent hydrolase (beta-lactamase superfamily II)